MESLRSLATRGDLQGLDSCEEKLGGALVGALDGSFWAPCIITGRPQSRLEGRGTELRGVLKAKAWSSTPAPWSSGIQTPLCFPQRCLKCCASDLGDTFAQVTKSSFSALS